MGNSLSSPLVQSEKWNQEAPQTSLQFSHRKLYDQSSCTREHASSPVNTNRLKSALKKAGDKVVTAVIENTPGSIQRNVIDTFVGDRWAKESLKANGWIQSKGPKRLDSTGQKAYLNTKEPQYQEKGWKAIPLEHKPLKDRGDYDFDKTEKAYQKFDAEHPVSEMPPKKSTKGKNTTRKKRSRKARSQGKKGKKVSFKRPGRPRKPGRRKSMKAAFGIGYQPGRTPRPRKLQTNASVCHFSDFVPMPAIATNGASGAQTIGDAQITAGLNTYGQGVCVAKITFNPNLISEVTTLLSTKALSYEQYRFENVQITFEATTMTAFASGTGLNGMTTPSQGQLACVFDSNIDVPFAAVGQQVSLDRIRTHQSRNGGGSTTGVMKNHIWRCPKTNMGDPMWYKIQPTTEALNEIQTTAYIFQMDSPTWNKTTGVINNWQIGKIWASGVCRFREDTITVLPGAMDQLQSPTGDGWQVTNTVQNYTSATVVLPTTNTSLPPWNGQVDNQGAGLMPGSNLGVGMATIGSGKLAISVPLPGNYLILGTWTLAVAGTASSAFTGFSGGAVIGNGAFTPIVSGNAGPNLANYTVGQTISDGYFFTATAANAIMSFTPGTDFTTGPSVSGGLFALSVIFLSPGFNGALVYPNLTSPYAPGVARRNEAMQIEQDVGRAMSLMETEMQAKVDKMFEDKMRSHRLLTSESGRVTDPTPASSKASDWNVSKHTKLEPCLEFKEDFLRTLPGDYDHDVAKKLVDKEFLPDGKSAKIKEPDSKEDWQVIPDQKTTATETANVVPQEYRMVQNMTREERVVKVDDVAQHVRAGWFIMPTPLTKLLLKP
jgi:hypothetical protein